LTAKVASSVEEKTNNIKYNDRKMRKDGEVKA
jgi:hypothetical protein